VSKFKISRLVGVDQYGNSVPPNELVPIFTGQFNSSVVDYANNSFSVNFVTAIAGSYSLYINYVNPNLTLAVFGISVQPGE
jgi:hypothetical protein